MAVAMKDLEIRGAGNLLGGEQSGHIQGVGFDLYVRLVGEAVADFRGDAVDAAGRDQDRAARRRAPAARLRAGGAAAPRGLQEARDGRDRSRPSTRSRPSCATATARRRSPSRTSSRSRGCASWPASARIGDIGAAGQGRALRPGQGPAREPAAAAHAPLPGDARQGGPRHHPRPGPDDGPGGRQAAARRRGADVGAPAHHGRPARRHRRRVGSRGSGASAGASSGAAKTRVAHRRMSDASARGGNQ